MSDTHGLQPAVARAFYGDFHGLRPIQLAAIKPILDGECTLLCSGTGSGKTEAALAPLLSRSLKGVRAATGVGVLYITPTKALANDLARRLAAPLERLGLTLGIRHGDRDDLVLAEAPKVLLTTPESLEVLMLRRDRALESVCAVVIDEVHLVYNTQRGLQLAILLQRLQEVSRWQQWAALSATVGAPRGVVDFLFGSAAKATILEFSSDREIDAQVRHVSSQSDLGDLLRRLFSGAPLKVLLFGNSRRVCETLSETARAALGNDVSVFTHYSSLSDSLRTAAEKGFARERRAVCVATSTLELGVDIGDIDLVALWGAPHSVESFLQRIGRGNRRSSKANVLCLVPNDATEPGLETLRFLALVHAARHGALPSKAPYRLYGAVSQQCLAMVAANGGAFTPTRTLLAACEPLSHVKRPDLERVLDELVARGYLQRHGFKNRYGADQTLHKLVDYRMIYGNYAAASQAVEVRVGTKVLGDVPAVNLLRLTRGRTLRMAGKAWEVVSSSADGIKVRPAAAPHNAIDISYGGSAPGVDAFLAQYSWEVLQTAAIPDGLLHASARREFEAWRSALAVSADTMPYRSTAERHEYRTFAGRLVNRAVALWFGESEFTADDTRLVTRHAVPWTQLPIEPAAFASIFESLFESTLEQSLFQTLLPADMQLAEFLEEWHRDPTIPTILRRLSRARVAALPAL